MSIHAVKRPVEVRVNMSTTAGDAAVAVPSSSWVPVPFGRIQVSGPGAYTWAQTPTPERVFNTRRRRMYYIGMAAVLFNANAGVGANAIFGVRFTRNGIFLDQAVPQRIAGQNQVMFAMPIALLSGDYAGIEVRQETGAAYNVSSAQMHLLEVGFSPVDTVGEVFT